MSAEGHIVVLYNKNTKETKKMPNLQKQVQTKLAKGLLDLIILQFLKTHSMHGYQVITKIRKSFGVYFGPSTIYPLLASLEKKGQVKSAWNMTTERPRKVYTLTAEGEKMLSFTESSLNLIVRKIGGDHGDARGFSGSCFVKSGIRATVSP
jgi:DNA-binding PadR family transcriptional regulator